MNPVQYENCSFALSRLCNQIAYGETINYDDLLVVMKQMRYELDEFARCAKLAKARSARGRAAAYSRKFNSM